MASTLPADAAAGKPGDWRTGGPVFWCPCGAPNLTGYLVNPTHLLLALTLVLTPILVAARSLVRYALGGRTGGHRAPGAVRLGARATAVLAAAMAAVILTSSAGAVTGRPGDNDRVQAVLDKAQPSPSAPPPETRGPLDPGRDLSRAAARRALQVAGTALPGWSAVELEPGSGPGISPAACESASADFDAKWKAVRTSPAEHIAFRTTDKARDRPVAEIRHGRCIAAGGNEVCGMWITAAIDSLRRQQIAGLDRLLSGALSATVADLSKR